MNQPISGESVSVETPSWLCVEPLGLYFQLKGPLPASLVCVALASGRRGIRGPLIPKDWLPVPSLTPLALATPGLGLWFPVTTDSSELLCMRQGLEWPFNTYTHSVLTTPLAGRR